MTTKIAWFTPYPPETSAIAEYSLTVLAELLKRDVEVDLWVDNTESQTEPQLGIRMINYVRDKNVLGMLNDYHIVIYNMGNHLENHFNIYETSLKYPGVVILHDYVLHHFFAAYYFSKMVAPSAYIRAMELSHGMDGKKVAERVISQLGVKPVWETDEVFKYPLNEPALLNALGVVTHSEFTMDLISNSFDVPTQMIGFPSKTMNLTSRKTKSELGISPDKTVLLTIGDVNPNKRIQSILDVLSQSAEVREKVIYIVIGRYSPGHFDIHSLIRERGLEHVVKVLGRQPDEVVMDYLQITDIGINLRHPTMGESSWTLPQMMAMRIPCLVTDTGSYHEISDESVVKISIENELDDISRALSHLVTDDSFRNKVGESGRLYAEVAYSVSNYCDRLLDFCRLVQMTRPVYRLIDQASLHLADMGVNIKEDEWLIDRIAHEVTAMQDLNERQGREACIKFFPCATDAVRDFDATPRLYDSEQVLFVPDLLKYDGIDFITNLYRRILLREPDTAGLEHHIRLLSEGASKSALIYLVSRSPEARRTQVLLTSSSGLKRKFMYYKLKRVIRKLKPLQWLYNTVTMPSRLYAISRDFSLFLMGYDKKLDHLKLSHAQEITDLQQEISFLRRQWENSHAQEITNLQQEISLLRTQCDSIPERLSHILETQSTAFSCGEVVITKVDQFIIGVPAEDWRLAGYLAFKGGLEPGLSTALSARIKPGMTIIDVGANIGLHTLLATSLVGLSGRVYSFEPTPRVFDVLENNVQLNGFKESGVVSLYNMAVTDRSDTMKLAIYEGNCGHNTLFPAQGDTAATIDIPTVSLDDVITGKVDIVKIDAEGSEPLVLRGMQRIINENPNITIFMEFAPTILQRAGVNVNDFIAEILVMGFQIKIVEDTSGELIDTTPGHLVNAYSLNIVLQHRLIS